MNQSDQTDDVISLLLHFVEFGRTISVALETVADTPELVQNSSLMALSMLHLEGPQRPSDLQARTALTSGGVTKLLERLEDSGLVQRRSGMVPEDGRAVVVTITETGAAQLQRLARQFSDHLDRVESFTRDTVELVAALRRVAGDDAS